MTTDIAVARPRHVQVIDHVVKHVDGVSEPSAVDADGPGGTVDRVVDEVDEQFLALVCSDPAWLRAEFDAIIAAAWSSPPPAGPGSCRAATQPEKQVGSSGPAGPFRPRRSRYPVRDHADRTRSPPSTRRRRREHS